MNEIEEMAKLTCGVFDSNGTCDGCPLRFCPPCAPKARASVLYKAGYRKQRVGRWVYKKDTYTYICSECVFGESEDGLDHFCPTCGAKMEGESDER